MTDLNLDRLARLEAEATPGPWEADCCSAANMVYGQGDSIGVDATREDAEFIAEMRNAAPALLARVRELEATVEKVRALHRQRGASWPHNGGTFVCAADGASWPCPTIEAIGGDDA